MNREQIIFFILSVIILVAVVLMHRIYYKRGKGQLIKLASKSPRRKEILEREDFNVVIVEASGEDNIVGKEYSKEIVEKCAKNKVLASFRDNFEKDMILVAADTVVVNDGIIYGKPKDREDAFKTLKSLVGKKHIVCSAVCVIKGKGILVGSEETEVYFKDATDDEIYKYIDSAKPYDKAGAYGIQDEQLTFFDHIEGSYDNVVGFPLDTFKNFVY